MHIIVHCITVLWVFTVLGTTFAFGESSQEHSHCLATECHSLVEILCEPSVLSENFQVSALTWKLGPLVYAAIKHQKPQRYVWFPFVRRLTKAIATK